MKFYLVTYKTFNGQDKTVEVYAASGWHARAIVQGNDPDYLRVVTIRKA